jgi:hypothetical protein
MRREKGRSMGKENVGMRWRACRTHLKQNLFQDCNMPLLKFNPSQGSWVNVMRRSPSLVVMASGSYL